jgi:hypothetical protein
LGLCRACFFRVLSRRRHGVLFIIMGRLFALSRRKGAYPGPDHRKHCRPYASVDSQHRSLPLCEGYYNVVIPIGLGPPAIGCHIVGHYALKRQCEAGSGLRCWDRGHANFPESTFHALG